jgi:hypothetical protein
MSKQAMLTLSAVAALCVLATMSIQARAAGQDGMTVTIDPVTHQKRAPTADEMKALRAATPPSAGFVAGRSAQPSAVTRRDGARGVRVGDSHLVYEVVTRDADGKLSSQCVQGENAAQEALSHPANAADKESAHESR